MVIQARTESEAKSRSRRATERPADLMRSHDLLRLEDGMMRVPFLIRGELRIPERVERREIEAAFERLDREAGPSEPAATHVALERVQAIREPRIDRDTLRPTGAWVYTVMPLFDPEQAIERDLDALEALYDLPFEAVLEYVARLSAALDPSLLAEIEQTTRSFAQQPDAWHAAAFAAIPVLLDPSELLRSVDDELGASGIPGSHLLDGFKPASIDRVEPAPVNRFAEAIFEAQGHVFEQRRPEIRALPTRQLHITAGNSPHIPFMSALRAIATKSPALIKSPYGAVLPGALLALAAATQPDHPITRHLSIAYWPGGEDKTERVLLAPKAFDRIVVWGAPAAVESVKSRAMFTRVVTFDPRFGVSLIGREAFSSDQAIAAVARRTVCDALVANQKACIATQVVYVEGDDDQIARLARALRDALAAFDAEAPNLVTPGQRGDVKRLMKGIFLDAEWYTNERDGAFSSAVVVARQEFKISALPMCRLLVVRPVGELGEALAYLHPGVATVSVFPEPTRRALATRIGARGVSNIVPLGHSGTGFGGQPHDGMRVLSQLVDWKIG